MVRFALVSVLALLAFAPAARADSPKALPFHPGPKVSIQGYGRQNPECREWTDGCVLCSAGDDGHALCSTPGIACEPHGLTCKRLVKPK